MAEGFLLGAKTNFPREGQMTVMPPISSSAWGRWAPYETTFTRARVVYARDSVPMPDPSEEVARLRSRVAELEDEVRMLRGYPRKYNPEGNDGSS